MAENRRGRDQGLYYWSRGQLLILAAGFTITTVVVFFFGILIGQGIEERKLVKKEEPLIKIPVQPLSQGSAASGAPGKEKEEMTFYESLGKTPTGGEPARVESAKEVKPTEKAVKLAAKGAGPPEKEERVASVKKIEKVKAAEKVKEKAAAEKTASVVEAKKEAEARKPTEAEGAKAGTEEREKAWAVQVNAYPLERDAKSLAKKLKDKGYDAYVVPTNIKGKNWYRVRVGHLQTQEQAKGLQETLKRKENFTKSITTSR